MGVSMLGKLLGKKDAGKGDLDSLKQRFNSIQQAQSQPAQRPLPPQAVQASASPVAPPVRPPSQPVQSAQYPAPPGGQPVQGQPLQSRPAIQRPAAPAVPAQQGGFQAFSPTQQGFPQGSAPLQQGGFSQASATMPQGFPQASVPVQQPGIQESPHFEVVEVIGAGGSFENVSLDGQSPASQEAPVERPAEDTGKGSVKKISRYLDDLKNQLDDTKLTSLIIQQVKELIEIDQNLNNKIKDLEDALKKEAKERERLKELIDKHHEEFKKSEKNMDKFIALYEVVTNQFNPFVEQGLRQDALRQPKSISSIPGIPRGGQENQSGQTAPAIQSIPQVAMPPPQQKAQSMPPIRESLRVEGDNLYSQAPPSVAFPPPQSPVASESGFQPQGSLPPRGAPNIQPFQVVSSPPPPAPANAQASYLVQSLTSPQAGSPAPFPIQQSTPVKPARMPVQEIPRELHFETKDGQSIRNLSELVTLLKGMSSDVFDHHVTKTGNDFAAWVHHVIRNESLAQELGPIKNRLDMINAIMRHL